MGFKLKFSKDLKRLLKDNDQKGLVPQVRKEFSIRGPVKVKQAIVQDVIRGVSPVKGKGKWVRYSNSYKEQIRGKAAFRKYGGKTVKFTDTLKVAELNKDFKSKQSPTKKISPVNLRLSGKMHKDIKSSTAGGYFTNFRLIVAIKNKLADIHNRLGAGKSKVIRRLLPTENGEQFNKAITDVLLDQLKKAAEKVVKEINRQ